MALIDQLANPARANIPQALLQRQQFADIDRQNQARDIAGQVLGQTFAGKLGALAQFDPDQSLKLAKELGIPADSKGRLDNLIGITIQAEKLLASGLIPEAIQLLDESATNIERFEGPQGAQRLRVAQQALMTGDQTIIGNFRKFAQAVSPLVEQKPLTASEITKSGQVVTRDSQGRPIATDIQGFKEGAKTASVKQREFERLTKDLTDEQKQQAILIELGLAPRAVGNAIQTISGDKNLTEQVANASATIKQRVKFAEASAISRSKTIDQGFDRMNKIDAGLRNIDRAIVALESGAGVGAIERLLPSIKAASVALDNIQGSMALDVIGAVTFGALSKGELDLAKQIALPTGLDTPQLIQHLQDRKAAQQKLRAYFNEQIQFLDQGGTVAGFLRQREGDQGQAAAQQPAVQTPIAQQNLSQLTTEQLQQMLQQAQ